MPLRRIGLWLTLAIGGLTACGDDDGTPAPREVVGPPAGSDELEWGEQLFQTRGCVGCHRIDGGPSVGPPLDSMVGRPRTLADGTEIVVDEDYLRQSVLQPRAARAPGSPSVMPSYEGLLEPAELDALILYLQSLTRTPQ